MRAFSCLYWTLLNNRGAAGKSKWTTEWADQTLFGSIDFKHAPSAALDQTCTTFRRNLWSFLLHSCFSSDVFGNRLVWPALTRSCLSMSVGLMSGLSLGLSEGIFFFWTHFVEDFPWCLRSLSCYIAPLLLLSIICQAATLTLSCRIFLVNLGIHLPLNDDWWSRP